MTWSASKRCCLSAALLVLLGAATAGRAAADNPIPVENTQLGTTAWHTGVGEDKAIQGYASEISVLPGEVVHFHVSTDPPELYHIHVYRLGWYGGTGGRCRRCSSGS